MEITHGSQLTYEPVSLSHRGSGLGFKHLALGSEADPKNNFWLSLGKQKAFYSPAHKHNFDQFRYAYSGSFNLTPSLTLAEGQLAYHPEGVEYGPQNDGDEERILLVLQCGGASGQGFLSHRQLKRANEVLSGMGRFEKGKFVQTDEESGEERRKDGYQAIWEWAMGPEREMVYPRGRYQQPIVMDPEAFGWRAVAPLEGGGEVNGRVNGGKKEEEEEEHAKVWKRTFGVFSERELRVEGLKLQAGGWMEVGGEGAIHVLFMLKGTGFAAGVKDGEEEDEEHLEQESTVRLNPGASVRLWGKGGDGEEGMELLHFVMPTVY
jgi:hypothetical protein